MIPNNWGLIRQKDLSLNAITRQVWMNNYATDTYGYALTQPPDNTVAIHVTMPIGYRPAALGFTRHRDDNVNPRSLRSIQEVEPDVNAEPEEPAEQKKRK